MRRAKWNGEEQRASRGERRRRKTQKQEEKTKQKGKKRSGEKTQNDKTKEECGKNLYDILFQIRDSRMNKISIK